MQEEGGCDRGGFACDFGVPRRVMGMIPIQESNRVVFFCVCMCVYLRRQTGAEAFESAWNSLKE